MLIRPSLYEFMQCTSRCGKFIFCEMMHAYQASSPNETALAWRQVVKESFTATS